MESNHGFVVSTEVLTDLEAIRRDEERLPFSNYSLWKHPSPPCHPDRSAAQWRDLRFSGPFLEMFLDSGRFNAAYLGSRELAGG
jgi:hypothetical protein